MPLLRRKPFERIKPPSDLKADEEIFHCKLTNEIFREYERYYERIILCNSLVWSCALTGKPNLTYAEAKQSEHTARRLVEGFPKELQMPTLYVASLAQRTSFLDLVEDVWGFLKDRFFVGEHVETHHGQAVVACEVTRVIPPSNEVTSPSKSPGKSKSSAAVLDSTMYQYEVIALKKEWAGKKILPAPDLRRAKGSFTRDKHKLFLRLNTETGPGGIIRIKDYSVRKHKLSSSTFSEVFAGPEPNFASSKRAQKALAGLNQETLSKEEKEQKRREVRNKRRKEKRRQMKEAKMLAEQQQNSQTTPRKRNSESGRSPLKNGPASPNKSPSKSAGKATSKTSKPVKKLTAEQQKQILIEKAKVQKEAEKQRKLEERIRAREKAREEKRRLEEFYKDWSKPREDLTCEDLKDLPDPCSVQCRIPNHLFGDFISVLEFLTTFKDVLSVRDFFPQGVHFDTLERALVEQEIAGPLSDLLQLLLNTLFTMQEEEEAEVQTAETTAKVDLGVGETGGSVTSEEAIRSATAAANWSQKYQGCSLGKLSLDSVTLSEVLRLHLLSSGGRCTEANSNWRFQQRGGYTLYDDPGLMLRINEPQILRALSTKTVIELSIGEKLQIVTCLMHQILMFASVRDIVAERAEKLKALRMELRNLQLLEKRRELEEINRIRQEKLKGKEGEAAAAAAAGAEPAAPEPAASEPAAPEPAQPVQPAPSAEEVEADRLKREKDSATKRAAFLTKEHKLQTEVINLEWGVTATPLGCDRAHRRYWIFQSLPGLFVEHDDDLVGPCLAIPTPHSRVQLCDDPMEYVRHLFDSQQAEEAGSSSSDKENERSPTSKKPASKLKSGKDDDEEDSSIQAGLVCTGEQDSCPVHSTVLPRVHWAFYNRTEELDSLLNNLNQRGLREGELRQALINSRARLDASMAKCPAHLLGRPEDEIIVEAEATRRSARQVVTARNREDANLNFPPGTPVVKIMEDTLRDIILDLEEKIHMGGLGSLKVANREAWRETIERGEYEKYCEKLTWGGKRNVQTDAPLATDKLLSKIKSEDRVSRPGTPDSVESGPSFQDPLSGENSVSEDVPVTIRTLACAILQVEQAIETRYLAKPLGENEKERLKRQKKLLEKKKKEGSEDGSADEEEEEEKPAQISQLGRWEMSLMASTNFSQLFLHFSTLENSVTWAKSALNARCRVCRRKGDGENMLLCDGCDKGHHLYCLKPQLKRDGTFKSKTVPQGEWFCPTCRPKEVKPPTPRKSRRIFTEEESEEEEEEDSDEEEEQDDDEENSNEEEEDGEVDTCATCGENGDLATCEECRNSYHPACAKPRLRAVPRSAWTCYDCREPKPKGGAKKHGAVVMAQKSVSSRRSAREASNKISKAAKRLRSNSWDGDTDSSRTNSLAGDDTPTSNREKRARRQPRWLTLECEDTSLPLNTSLLHVLLTDILAHADAWPFLRPVQRSEAPDYHQIIKRPMDFGTIKYKLNMMEYRNNSELIADALLVFENCQMYNQSDADEYKAGVKLHKFFERKCQELGLRLQEEELEAPEAKKPRRQI